MNEADELEQAISTTWDQIISSLGGDRELFECQLTTLLRQLDAAVDQEQRAIIQSIINLFQKYDAAHKLLLEAISQATSHRNKGAGVPAAFVKKDRYTVVPVFYGTDRAISGKHDTPMSYSGERGDLTFGIADVSIPDDHRMGKIEKPNIWKLQFREDPNKHIVVLSLEPLSATSFAERARNTLNRSAKKEVLLFVHGYNVSFSDAISRTAQIAYDLHFEGIPALYSWPSEGAVLRYAVDETNVTWSRPRFAEFLATIKEKLGAETVHIIAHSMGNRLVAETIASMPPAVSTRGARIRQIVFAAPDIDAATFKDLAIGFLKKAERFTLYASSNDKALMISRVIHKHPRAGDSGFDLVVIDSLDTVDATAIDTSLFGHSYYGDNRSVITDIFELVRRGTAPHERAGLSAKSKYGARYWLFNP
jgi:esterase/lipase superfamily enzyme